jgi:hypothetical protein
LFGNRKEADAYEGDDNHAKAENDTGKLLHISALSHSMLTGMRLSCRSPYVVARFDDLALLT